MNLLAAQRPLRVYGSGAQNVNHLHERYDGEVPDILDNAFVIVDYDGGIRALLDLCMFAENSTHELMLAVTGDGGKAEVLLPAGELVLARRDRIGQERSTFDLEPRIREAGAHHGATYFEHLAFLDAIRRGGAPAVGVADAALAVAIGTAAERSVAEHRPVDLAEVGY